MKPSRRLINLVFFTLAILSIFYSFVYEAFSIMLWILSVIACLGLIFLNDQDLSKHAFCGYCIINIVLIGSVMAYLGSPILAGLMFFNAFLRYARHASRPQEIKGE